MLILQISDQLGNQMFAYAAVKSIALDLNYKFGLYHEKTNSDLCNDSDEIFGHLIDTIFKNIRSEIVEEIPEKYQFYRENTTIHSHRAYLAEAYKVDENTVMTGHYICPGYFEHRIDEVRKWFSFPEEVDDYAKKLIDDVRSKYGDKKLKIVSAHFRNADDYRNGGFMLNDNYWFKAAEALKMKSGFIFVFAVFYDKKTKLVERFIKEFNAFEIHYSLVVDMCTISKCDAHIVCNSSFSIMSALLNKNNPLVFRPSKFYIPDGSMPDDVFPSSWNVVKASRNEWLEYKRKFKLMKSLLKIQIKTILGLNEK